MDRPLWRMVIPLMILGFALQRGALVAFALPEVPTVITVAAVLQVGALLALALGIFLGRRWALGAAVAFALAVAGTAALGAASGGAPFVVRSVAEVVMAILVVAGVAWLTRHEFGSPRGPGTL